MEQPIETVAVGNTEYHGTDISDERPHESHCWHRAATHILKDKEWDYFERMEAAATCMKMVEAIIAIPRPPKRANAAWGGVQWGWGKGWPGL